MGSNDGARSVHQGSTVVVVRSLWNNHIIWPHLMQAQLVMDARSTGWGAVLGDKSVAGYRNQRLQYCSSHYRERLTILLGLKSFEKKIMDKSIHWVCTDKGHGYESIIPRRVTLSTGGYVVSSTLSLQMITSQRLVSYS